MMGHVKLLDSIPYNYRQLNLDLFERMQQTQTSSGPGPGLQVIQLSSNLCEDSQCPEKAPLL